VSFYSKRQMKSSAQIGVYQKNISRG